jgi:CheY-specific phosphatase CheX
MSFNKTIIPRVMDSILSQTRRVLLSEAALEVLDTESLDCDVDNLQLHDLTAIAGLGGPISLLIAFSFERSLIEAITQGFTADIGIPEGEEAFYRRETAGEIVNTILGLCTSDFHEIEQTIALSPPVILEDARCIHRPRNAVFASMRLRTASGIVTTSLVGPREMFDDHLNCLA